MRPALAALLPAVLALPAAAADLTCRFDIECYDAEACAATDYEVTFGPLGDRWLMSSIAGERAFTLLGEEDDNRAFASGNTNGAVALLTLTVDGTALYAEHGLFAPPYSVAYRGACVEAG